MAKKEWENDLLDVSAESSPANDPNEPNDSNLDPDPGAGNLPGNDGAGAEDSGRGIDEVRGEMMRKMEASEKRLMARFDSFQAQQVPQTPDSGGGSPEIKDMNVQQLQDLYTKAETPQQQAYLNGLIGTKLAREAVGSAISGYDQERTARDLRKESMTKAFGRFPELHDKDSSFHGAVMDEMEALGDGANSPGALLSVANEVAFRLGYTGKSAQQQDVGGGSRVTGGRSTRPVVTPDSEFEVTDEAYDATYEGLKHAFPNGVSDKMKARIKARGKEYNRYRNDPNNPFTNG